MKKTLLIIVFTLIIGLGVGFYFGYDRGFERAIMVDEIRDQMQADASSDLLLGQWQSVDDTKFTREFKDKNIVIDRYEGIASDTQGTWLVFTKETSLETVPFNLESDVQYLSITMPQSELLFFKIVELKENYLELAYLNRGGVLRFTKK